MPNQRDQCAYGIPRVSVPRHLSIYQQSRGTETPQDNNRKSYLCKNFTHLDGGEDLKRLDLSVFDYPKPVKLIILFLQIATDVNDLILDFFAGSCTTAQAVMELNQEDDGNRPYIMVQLPEPTPENSAARKAGFDTIAEVGKEGIRRVCQKSAESSGFRVF